MRRGMMTSRHYLRRPIVLVALALLIPAGAVGGYYLYEWVTCGLAMGGYIWDETRYAAGYTEQLFGKVKQGWSEQRVLSVLGKPLRTRTVTWRKYPGRRLELWQYSVKGPLGGHVRNIYFDRGRVIEVEAEWESG